MTYHEQIARAMSQSYSVGSFSSYEKILSALREKFPHEQDLRTLIKQMELKAAAMGAPKGWTLIDANGNLNKNGFVNFGL